MSGKDISNLLRGENEMKIYLLSVHNIGNNFGTTLQACALYDYVSEIKPDTRIINYRPRYSYNKGKIGQLVKKILYFKDATMQEKRYREYYDSHSKLTEKVEKYSDLRKFNDGDLYIIGSDQVWNPSYDCGNDPAYYLEFVSGNKIAYSASVGQVLDDSQIKNLCALIKDFSYIGVRESCTYEQLSKLRSTNIKHVVDPVFLHSVQYYRDAKFQPPFSNYILVYAVTYDEEIEQTIQEARKLLGKKIVLLGGYRLKYSCDLYYRSAGPSEFTNLIMNCDLFIANSFHGCAFSILFERQFVVFKSKVAMERIASLLKRLDLEERMISKSSELKEQIANPIRYNTVTKNLKGWIEESKEFLNSAIRSFEK